MHIPDGYISPQTALALGAAMVPVWSISAKKAMASLKARQVPLVAMLAAFSFVMMMFNIPVPDGTTAHVVGGTLMAIILGPWLASIGISVVLAIQALLFGDGGIWSFGANAFNLAFVMPFSGYYLYRLMAGRSAPTSRWRWISAGVAGFVSINLAALTAAIQFGIQPVLFRSVEGVPLYSPYPMSMAVFAMAFAHLLVAGPVEGVMTGLVVRYLHKNHQSLLRPTAPARSSSVPVAASGYRKLWLGLAALMLLTPLGLLAKGGTWGEWTGEEVRQTVGFLPAGMAKLAVAWSHTVLPDYALAGWGNTFWQSAAGYIVSAGVGLAIIFALVMIGARLLPGKNRS